MTRRIFIGDIHGHYDGLMRLLEAVDLDFQDDVYFVGDLIDRGPKAVKSSSMFARMAIDA
jgi:serine/threonine protein phosphatase 1